MIFITIQDDPIYKDFEKRKSPRSENTIFSYRVVLQKLTDATGESLTEIYEKCKNEQRDRIENNTIIKFSPDSYDSHINKYYNAFEEYCEKRNNSNNTINGGKRKLDSFFHTYGLNTPKWIEREDDAKEWNKLSKKDIEYVLDDSPLNHKALILFLLSTGMRLNDALSLKIRDFMDATKAMGYHHFVEVDDFIDGAPDDMIGYWSFEPEKTKEKGIKCKTFNTAEASNMILRNLRKIKNESIPKKNKRFGKNAKLTKDSALFSSRNKDYVGRLSRDGISTNFVKKNKKLRAHRIIQIDQKIANGDVSEDDREELINKIPKFHAHGLRKFFTTTINRYGGSKVCAMMEGHAPLGAQAKSYNKITMDCCLEVFKRAQYDLSIYDVDEDKIFESKSAELEDKIREKDKEIAELKKQIEKNAQTTNQEVIDLKETVYALESRLSHLNDDKPIDVDKKDSIITFILNMGDAGMWNAVDDEPPKLAKKLMSLSGEEKLGLAEIAYELVEYDENYEGTYEYDSKVVKKALREWRKNPLLMEKAIAHNRIFEEQYEKLNDAAHYAKKILDEDGFWEDDEIDDIIENILNYLFKNRSLLNQRDVDKKFIEELIEKFE